MNEYKQLEKQLYISIAGIVVALLIVLVAYLLGGVEL